MCCRAVQDDVRNHGKWASTPEISYLTDLNIPTATVSAGNVPGTWELPRGRVSVPPELCKLVLADEEIVVIKEVRLRIGAFTLTCASASAAALALLIC